MANILIVDDSSDILEAMRYILEMEGFSVRTVTGKISLMKDLEQNTPDLILLDILLSGDNGIEICKELKNNEDTKHIPVVLMSASPKMLQNHEECGATDVIAKPFHLTELSDKINSILKMLPVLLINFQQVSHNIIHHL